MDLILLSSASGASGTMGFLKPLYWLFGQAMHFLLQICGNQYYVALVVFTVITRLILLPLNVKQQKTMAKTTRLQPKIQKIQKKYPDMRDRDKMNQEMQELYAREGHNPMQMGCGPMLFQMIFLMGIIGIIYYPLQYIIGVPHFEEYYKDIVAYIGEVTGSKSRVGTYFQLDLIANFNQYRTGLQAEFPKVFTDSACASIETYRNSLTLFGLNMSEIPHWKTEAGAFNTLVIIPILCLLTSLGSSLFSTLIQKKNNPAMQQNGQMMMMMLMMPFFSFYISFKVTAAVGFYWIISNIVAVFQQLYIFKVHPPKKTQARNMVENTIERRSREENIKNMK